MGHGSDRFLGGMAPFLFGTAAMFATMYSTQAVLPELSRSFAITPSEAGLTVSVTLAALALGAWFWGPLSDRIGRRRSLLLASAALIPPSIAAAIAPSFGVLLVVRAIQGACMPGLLTVGVPYVMEAYNPRIGPRAMGYYLTALVAGSVVGRVGVALVSSIAGWRVGLAVLALLPLASTIVMRRTLPSETEPVARSGGHWPERLGRLLHNPVLVAAALAGSAFFFAFMGVFSYITFRLEEPPFSLAPTVVSGVFLLWITGAVGPFAGRMAGRFGWHTVVLTSLALAICGLTVTLVPLLPVVILGLVLVTLGNFSGVTAAQIGVTVATVHDRGMASALYFSAYYAAGGLGGYVPGVAWELGGWTGVATLAIGAYCVGFCAVAALARRLSGEERGLRRRHRSLT